MTMGSNEPVGVAVIDAFPEFLEYWEAVRTKPIEQQIDAWAADYMSRWPELLEKQIDSYKEQGCDWRDVARERVFPYLEQRLAAMGVARESLLALCEPVYQQAQAALGLDVDLTCLIYVGVGCGAGWATRLAGRRAILFGLENVAECGWQDRTLAAGLIAHEIGHVAHGCWREQAGAEAGRGPLWELYEEGFGQRCEHVILGRESWHESAGINEPDWLDWCRQNVAWLAGDLLRRIDTGEPVRPFFGHWFDVRGRRQCGYFLGHELIRQAQADSTLKQIAIWDASEVERRMRAGLELLTK